MGGYIAMAYLDNYPTELLSLGLIHSTSFADDDAKKELIEYREPNGGNMAIHFAVLKGNKRIIDYLLRDFHADPYVLTTNGLSVIHCATQFERGVLSIEMFSD